MSEKDLEKALGGSGDVEPESAAEAGTVKFEQNDNWQFEASAPSLEEGFFQGENNVVFENIGAGENSVINNAKLSESASLEIEQQVKSKIKKKIMIALSVLICAALAAIICIIGINFFTVPNTEERMTPGNIAVTVGETKISVGLYNYYYDEVVDEYLQYAQYGYIDLDVNKDFATQFTTDDDGNEISYLEFFKQQTFERLKANIYYYELAVKNGLGLTDTQKENIKTQLEAVEQYAADEGLSVNAYIAKNFNEYCGLATLEKFLEQYYTAANYYYRAHIDNRATDEEVNAYFNEHQTDYQSCSIAILEISYDTAAEGAMQEALNKANAYAGRITDVSSMKALVPEACAELIASFVEQGYFSTEDEAVAAVQETIELSETRADILSNYGEDAANWVFGDSKAGETHCSVDEEAGMVYIILKTDNPVLADTKVYSVRHILVMPESANASENTDENATSEVEYTEAEWAAAEEKAKNILAEYNKGNKTEAAFAELAEKYSDDINSTSNGSSGYYGGGFEGIALGSMVPEFESWATDSVRKAGNVEIVKSEFGYHIMYFIYCGPEYLYNAASALENDQIMASLKAFEVKEHKAIKKVQEAKPSTDSSSDYSVY